MEFATKVIITKIEKGINMYFLLSFPCRYCPSVNSQATFLNQHQISSVSSDINHSEVVAYVSPSGYWLNIC